MSRTTTILCIAAMQCKFSFFVDATANRWDAGSDSTSNVTLAGTKGLKFSNAMRMILNSI